MSRRESRREHRGSSWGCLIVDRSCLRLSKYEYNIFLAILYCICIVFRFQSTIFIGSVIVTYCIQKILIFTHIIIILRQNANFIEIIYISSKAFLQPLFHNDCLPDITVNDEWVSERVCLLLEKNRST